MSKQQTHYCEACKVEHTFTQDEWPFWNSTIKDEKPLFWCNKGIDCIGCKKVHRKSGKTKGINHPSGKTLWICDKWIEKFGDGKIDWETWSPQEVMSGVHIGMDRDEAYGKDTENHGIVQSKQVADMEESLDELGDLEAQDRMEAW